MRLGTDTNSMTNYLMSGIKSETPAVGMGITFLGWTDRHAGTIVEVSKSGKRFVAQEDDAKRIDNNGMSECQEYEFSPSLLSARRTFTKRRNGTWAEVGSQMGRSSKIIIGQRDKYHDFSF